MSRLFSLRIAAAVAALVSFIVYLFTMAPGLDFIDAGELATVATTLGIAHPTGYPLFTIVGWVFSHLPIAGTVIARLNIMSAFFMALASGASVMLIGEILGFWTQPKETKAQNQPKGKANKAAIAPSAAPISTEVVTIASFAAGLTLAFSETWWAQSTAIEVYPLHMFLATTALIFFLRMLRNEEAAEVGKDGRLFALTLGFAFTNHLTTILLAPAVLYAFFARYGFQKTAWQRIARLALPFAAGLLVYLYLPLRSATHPIMDWGHPADAGSFLKHVTGGQYKIWMFTGAGAAAKNWSYFWGGLPTEFAPYLGVVTALLGLAFLWKNGRRGRVSMIAFSLLLFLGCLFYSINYDIHDIDSYFLLSYLAIGIWIGAGIVWATNYFQSKSSGKSGYAFASLALILPILELGVNWKNIDESGNHMVDDYTRNMIVNLPPNAIVFSSLWDFWVSGAFYHQVVEKLRPDVLVIDKAMLRDRPWYPEHLRQRAPDVMSRVEPELHAFMKYLVPFDRGEPFDEAAIAPAYQRFTSALVGKNLDRPIFVAIDLVQEPDELFAPEFKRVPAGVAFRLLPDSLASKTQSVSLPKFVWRDADYKKRNYYTDNARLRQAMPLAAYAEDAAKRGDLASAKNFIHLAVGFAPDPSQSLAALPARDKEIAAMTDENFSRMRQFEQSLSRAK